MSFVIRAGLTIYLMNFCVPQLHASSSNLIRNASFETVATSGVHNEALYWQMGSPDQNGDCWGSAAREGWRAHSGEHIGAIRGLWAGYGSSGGFWQDAKASPGETYTFSGWFYCDPEWVSRTQEIKLEFWDEKKKEKLESFTAPIQACDMKWEEVSLSATAPEGAVWIRAVVNVVNAGASGALQVDDLELKQVRRMKDECW